jgi:CHAD domain-containing protein
VTSSAIAATERRIQAGKRIRPVDIGLNREPLTAGPGDPPAVHVRAKLDEQVRALLEHEPVARQGSDPEGVHQMRVSVRRIRAALKAEGALVDDAGLVVELKWIAALLGDVRDLDVQLEHLRAQAADFEPAEREAVERLLLGLRADRRKARQRLLAGLRSQRYTELLAALAAAARSEVPPAAGPGNAAAVDLTGLVKRPYRKLRQAVDALDEDPPDDDLHALRIRGKRLRYAAELAAPQGGKPVRRLILATKTLQDILGDHQDAVLAEQEIRRLLAELAEPVDTDVVFAAGRLVERERGRRADGRASWRSAMSKVDEEAGKVLAG